jgi:hypothetical protein
VLNLGPKLRRLWAVRGALVPSLVTSSQQLRPCEAGVGARKLAQVHCAAVPGQQLEYEERGGRRDSAWSLVGFSLALVIALFSAWSWWEMWRSLRGGATAYSFGVTPLYYVVAGTVAAACVIGMGRGRRRFGLIGLVIAVASVVAMAALVWGSPWSPPRPIPTSTVR